MYPNYNYNCAWNSGTAVLAILGQISDGSSLGHKRIGIEIPAVYSSFIGKGKQFQPSPISNSSSSDTVVNFKKGRSVLMPVDPKVQKEGGVPSLSWLHTQIDGPVLTINRFAYGYPFPPLNYTIWHMDNYGPGLRKYSHLAHSNDKLYVIGSTVSTGGLAVTVLPFSLASTSSSLNPPELSTAETVETTMGQECNLEHQWTTASIHNGQLYLLCYPKTQACII
ncbi:hypothetical protein BGX23_008344 [Mortierella sp. AD031]|nr:hypothetical protein BGX23_008344 [Mortierella sp. AD031]